MAPHGALVPKQTRAYLHFCSAEYSHTLDQMDQLIVMGAFLILDMERVLEDYHVYRNEVRTITLKRADGAFERRLSNKFIEYALDRQGNNVMFPDSYDLNRYSRYLGEHPHDSLVRFFREGNYPARAVPIDEGFQEAIHMILRSEKVNLETINAGKGIYLSLQESKFSVSLSEPKVDDLGASQLRKSMLRNFPVALRF
jgi:hypothetical protein